MGDDRGQRAAGLRRRHIWHDAKKVAAVFYRRAGFGTVEKVAAAESYGGGGGSIKQGADAARRMTVADILGPPSAIFCTPKSEPESVLIPRTKNTDR